MIVARKCDNGRCQREYPAETRELNRGNGIYCSRKCSGEARTAAALATPKTVNAECAYCKAGIHITDKRRASSKSGLFFCSRSHQALGFSDPEVGVRSGPKRTTPVCATSGCNRKTNNPYCTPCRMAKEKRNG